MSQHNRASMAFQAPSEGRLHPSAEDAGIAWYNRLSEPQRAYWHRMACSARPVDAYRAYCKGYTVKDEQ